MTKAQQAQKATIDEIKSQEDFKRFFAMLYATKKVSKESLDELPTEQQHKIVNEYWKWEKKGKPEAEMPDLEDKEDQILKMYRAKIRGTQYIYYVRPDGTEVGRETIPTYATEEEVGEKGKPTGKLVEDKSKIIKTDYKYTIPYTKAKGEELLKKAYAYNDMPSCYFVIGTTKVKVADPETEFNVDGNQMMTLMRNAPGIKGKRI